MSAAAPLTRTTPKVQRKCDCAPGGDCGCGRKKKQMKSRAPAAHDHFEEEADRFAAREGDRLDPGGLHRPVLPGHDFSRVRIHDDAHAHARATAEGARAFTYGSDIYFARGELSRPDARQLVAHELAHTVQQGAATTVRRKVSDQYAQLTKHLSGAVTEAGVSAALKILQSIRAVELVAIEDFGDTIDRLDRDGLVDMIFAKASADDRKNQSDLLQEVQNHRRQTVKSGAATEVIHDSCNEKQRSVLTTARTTSLSWLSKALGLLESYQSAPAAAENAAVSSELAHSFGTQPEYVRQLVTRLETLRSTIRDPGATTYGCAAPTTPGCAGRPAANSAFHDGNQILFCEHTLTWDPPVVATVLVHESAHAFLHGLAPVTAVIDRAYYSQRLFAQLTPEEAFENAESYAIFVLHLSGETTKMRPAEKDDIACGAKNEELENAIARAERINELVVEKLTNMTEADFQSNYGASFGPKVKLSEVLANAYEVKSALHVKLGITCVEKDPHCTGTPIGFFWAKRVPKAELQVCPEYFTRPAEQRVLDAYLMLFQYTRNMTSPPTWPYLQLARDVSGGNPASRMPIEEPAPAVLPGDEGSYWWVRLLVSRMAAELTDKDSDRLKGAVRRLDQQLDEKKVRIRFNGPADTTPRYLEETNTLQLPPVGKLSDGELMLGLLRQSARIGRAGLSGPQGPAHLTQDYRTSIENVFDSMRAETIDLLKRARMVKDAKALTAVAAEASKGERAAISSGPVRSSVFSIEMTLGGHFTLVDGTDDGVDLGTVETTKFAAADIEAWLQNALRTRAKPQLDAAAAGGSTLFTFRVYMGDTKLRHPDDALAVVRVAGGG